MSQTIQINTEDLNSESDVEQKVILQIITNIPPYGLGYGLSDFKTKPNIASFKIDKGRAAKNYYPDYIIQLDNIPLIIIEAKNKGENLEEAYRQARLYALELNTKYKGVNPCSLVIACNGTSVLAGESSEEAHISFEVKDISPSDNQFSIFLELFSKKSLIKKAQELQSKIFKQNKYKKPIDEIRQEAHNLSIKNDFGDNMAIYFRHFFHPSNYQEKVDIVKNAYVSVKKHESHLTPIYKVITNKIAVSETCATEIKNTSNPTEIVNKLSEAHKYNNQVFLLIGAVGSGKSSFITKIKEVNLVDFSSKLTWITLDLNDAPLNKEEIYNWLKNGIIQDLIKQHTEENIHSISFLKSIFEENLAELKIGTLSLYNETEPKYRDILHDNIEAWRKDKDNYLSALIKYFITKKLKTLIIVLDNCDKRSLEDQLLMFEIANWIKSTVKAVVFLPLRDTTYDHFRNSKPLDTVVKDLTFRIISPPLEKVLQARLDYAVRLLRDVKNNNSFSLSNGMHVNIPAKDSIQYLQSIMKSLFLDAFFKRLITGLAGSNIRIGLEIFIDFCKSGHIPDEEILKMRHTLGGHNLPKNAIIRTFLKGNRVYYSDTASRVKNLFHSEKHDTPPNPFTRLCILYWLNSKSSEQGPTGIKGFHSANLLIESLQNIGFKHERLFSELNSLIEQNLVICETQTNRIELGQNPLLSISSAGIVHLDLIDEYKSIDYLAACAEDSLINDTVTFDKIVNNIKLKASHAITYNKTISNAEYFLEYLEAYYNDYYSNNNFAEWEGHLNTPIDFEEWKSFLQNKKSLLPTNSNNLKSREYHNGKIINKNAVGYFVELESETLEGFIYKSKVSQELSVGTLVLCERLGLNEKFNNFRIRIHKVLSE